MQTNAPINLAFELYPLLFTQSIIYDINTKRNQEEKKIGKRNIRENI